MKKYHEILASIQDETTKAQLLGYFMKHWFRDAVMDQPSKAQLSNYFAKYWLNEAEYKATWQPIQHAIFDPQAQWLPDMMFQPHVFRRR